MFFSRVRARLPFFLADLFTIFPLLSFSFESTLFVKTRRWRFFPFFIEGKHFNGRMFSLYLSNTLLFFFSSSLYCYKVALPSRPFPPRSSVGRRPFLLTQLRFATAELSSRAHDLSPPKHDSLPFFFARIFFFGGPGCRNQRAPRT